MFWDTLKPHAYTWVLLNNKSIDVDAKGFDYKVDK